MASVKTNTDATFVFDLFYNVTKVFKGIADDVSCACHVLEKRLDGLRLFMSTIECICDPREAGFTGVGTCVAGVKVVKLYAKALAAFQVIDERVVGLGGFVPFGLSPKIVIPVPN